VALLAVIAANLVGAMRCWDPYPFIRLNFAPSFQAAHANHSENVGCDPHPKSGGQLA
jgi:hypothetical protein